MTPVRHESFRRDAVLTDGLDALGPWPAASVAALLDLGLSEREIARYFRVTLDVVQLAQHRGASDMAIRDRHRHANGRADLGL